MSSHLRYTALESITGVSLNKANSYQFLAGLMGILLAAFPMLAQSPGLPSVGVELDATGKVRLSWPQSAAGFTMEESDSLVSSPWRPTAEAPVPDGNRFVVMVSPTASSRFYRLRSGPPSALTTIRETFPAETEEDVSVNRETVIYFSGPLAVDSTIDGARFYAEAGGRRLLSRVELSSDRLRASLFYLAPLPGGTRVQVVFDAAGLRDAAGREVDADGDGEPGGALLLSFETGNLTPVAGTAVIGQVFASEPMTDPQNPGQFTKRPLKNVALTVDGAEETWRTTTDAEGRFVLEPAPVGRFFVSVDGRTAEGSEWPNGNYYPVVGQAWEAFAGRADNLAGGNGEIFLPLIKQGTLKETSVSQNTVVTLAADVVAPNPASQGVAITVPANSLFSDNGTRGGRVGIALAPPDRLPAPLPSVLELPIVITIQTDGPDNFDRPVRVRFPNLPNPTTGKRLLPGDSSALWGFTRDTGQWEMIGPMTVSSDGNFVETDPGTGVLQPGWYGSAPGSSGGGDELQDGRDEAENELSAFAVSLKKIGLHSTPTPAPVPSLGAHYFVLINLETGLAEQRGRTGRNGIGHTSLIMAPDTPYRQWVLRASDLHVGTANWISASSGKRLRLPAVVLHEDSSLLRASDLHLEAVNWIPTGNSQPLRKAPPPDADGDGLSDVAEFILGTSISMPDTDGDGITDAAEVRLGSNPKDGKPVRTGVIASSDTPGNAVDVCAEGGFVTVADSEAGVAIFRVANGLNLIRVAQIDTPGNAIGVACTARFVAVADGPSGLAVIDLSGRGKPRILYQLDLGAPVNAVAIAEETGYAGLGNGGVVAFDLASGKVLNSTVISPQANIQDLAIAGQTLFVLAVGTLYAVALDEGKLRVTDSIPSPGEVGEGGRRLRLFVAEGRAYATFTSGYNVFDVSDRAKLGQLLANKTPQQGWKQIVPNGSGLGVAAVGAKSTDAGDHHISIYNLGPTGLETTFIATLATPGIASAVSLHDGVACVADGRAGLHLINFVAFDSKGVPPSISLSASFPLEPPIARENQRVRVVAQARDDVQVRNVEFLVDGRRIATDGNYEFESSFVTPAITPTKKSFTLQARATDTGGNSTTTALLNVALAPLAAPPRVIRTSPAPGAFASSARVVSAVFNEPVLEATVNRNTVMLRSAGPDNAFGTQDDIAINNGAVSYSALLQTASLTLPSPLPPGLYEARITPAITDLEGNALQAEVAWTFWALSDQDADGDGLPDNIEASLGYDPLRQDTNGNGIPDGREDFDGDRLGNAWELFFGLDPRVRDPNKNGVTDENEDPDNDGLANIDEFLHGTNPLSPDTDGDGWDDNGEVADGSNPIDASSRPLQIVSSATITFLNAVPQTLPSGTFIAASSATPSYLNALPETWPAGTPIAATSLSASYLNAVPDTLPSGTRMAASSAPVSFLNAIPETLPPGTLIAATSAAVSYLNARAENFPPGTSISTSSPTVSYLNSVPETIRAGAPIWVVSPAVSYRNR